MAVTLKLNYNRASLVIFHDLVLSALIFKRFGPAPLRVGYYFMSLRIKEFLTKQKLKNCRRRSIRALKCYSGVPLVPLGSLIKIDDKLQ